MDVLELSKKLIVLLMLNSEVLGVKKMRLNVFNVLVSGVFKKKKKKKLMSMKIKTINLMKMKILMKKMVMLMKLMVKMEKMKTLLTEMLNNSGSLFSQLF